ncbi:hypothetical protein D3C78_1494040 [compost metagenome]
MHQALHHQLGRVGKRRKAHVHGQAVLHAVDQVGSDLGFEQQRRVARDNVHELLAGLDHAADGLGQQAHHLAVGGRADFQARQFVGHGLELFALGEHLALHFGQLGLHFLALLLHA